MKRTTLLTRGMVRTYDRDGKFVSERQGETETYVPLHRDPHVFEALKAAIRAGENIIEIAQRFDTDHCIVLYWKHKLAACRG